MASPPPKPFVSRAGGKLAHALEAFSFDPAGMRCADFGCNVGGFSDCLLQVGAASIIAIDTGHNVLAWKLRSDDRVTVHERTNALHFDPPEGGVDLVVVDLAWTRQRIAIPVALRWLAEGGSILTLVKPHYELDEAEKAEHLHEGRLDHDLAREICDRTLAALEGVTVRDVVKSPMTGGKSSRKGTGNVEFVAWLEPA